jgi:hypothetical protein
MTVADVNSYFRQVSRQILLTLMSTIFDANGTNNYPAPMEMRYAALIFRLGTPDCRIRRGIYRIYLTP